MNLVTLAMAESRRRQRAASATTGRSASNLPVDGARSSERAPSVPSRAVVPAPEGVAAVVPAPEGFAGTKRELKRELKARGIPFDNRANRADLFRLLESDDERG